MLSSPGVGPPGGTSAASGRGPATAQHSRSLSGPAGMCLVPEIRYSAAAASLGGECDIRSLPVTVESSGVSPAIFANKPKGLLGTVETPRCGSPDPRGPPELTAQPLLLPAAPAPSSSQNHGV